MGHHIKDLIIQGEHFQLDFKFEVSDSRKIARSMVAFANTEGGKLLIGVKDNGVIAGVRSEEEYYMIEGAAQMYCKPVIDFKPVKWEIEGKTVLEIIIPKSCTKPVLAQNYDGKWLAYIRVKDQNILANSVMIKVWRKTDREKGILLKYSEKIKMLFDYLDSFEAITLSKYTKESGLKRFDAEQILVDLILLKIIQMIYCEKGFVYKFHDNQKPKVNLGEYLAKSV